MPEDNVIDLSTVRVPADIDSAITHLNDSLGVTEPDWETLNS